MTPLMCAAIRGNVDDMKVLILEYQANVNAQNNVSKRIYLRMCATQLFCFSFIVL